MPKMKHLNDDQREFLKMLDCSQRTIFQICLHFTDRQSESIRDLYQEIVCELWESWPTFQGKSSTDTWVRRIALNTAVDQIRHQVKQPRFVSIEQWMCEAIAEESTKAPPDYYRLVTALNSDDRALLYLRLDRISLHDIAEIYNTTEAAIKQRLYRLRQKIDTIKQQEDA